MFQCKKNTTILSMVNHETVRDSSLPGIDESVLSELRNTWNHKLVASKVLESDAAPAASEPSSIVPPYIALQQQNSHASIARAPGYQADKLQNATRNPAVPVMRIEKCFF